MIGELINSGSAPALEAMIRFAAQRQRLVAGNIANITDPNYVMKDASPDAFQAALRDAIDRRREGGPGQGPIDLSADQEVTQSNPVTGDFSLSPHSATDGILFHDRNNRSLETLEKDQVENAAVFRIAADLLKSHHDLIRAAISERP